jgi:hypothetical protein
MDEIPWTVAAWRRRQRETWRAARWWLVVFAVGGIGFAAPFYLERAHVHTVHRGLYRTRSTLSMADETGGEILLGLTSLIVTFLGGGGVIFGVQRHHRCPRCEDNPMGRRGFPMFPTVCRHCGARLI